MSTPTPEPAPPGVELVVTAGPNVGQRFRFAEHANFMVGRDNPHVQFSLPGNDGYVSRYHLIVEANPPLVRVRDMGSRNGTLVNGVKVPDADLKNGDEIRIGLTTLRIAIDGFPPPAGPPRRAIETLVFGPSRVDAPESHTFDASVVEISPNPTPPTPVPVSAKPATPPVSPPSPAPAAANQTGYKIVREIGRGGMGVVYEARHSVTNNTVAVKTILPAARPTPTAIKKFLREAEVVRHLDHPNIVKYADAGELDGILWFAMEFVSGSDAGRIVSRGGKGGHLAIGRACRWTVQLLDALAYAHTAETPVGTGFVHRDVKPSNMIVTVVDGKEQVKLADFGLAKAYEGNAMSGLTVTGSAGGTPQFMPPEQVRDMRTAKPPADIYSTGATLYWLLTQEFLFPVPAGGFQHIHQFYAPILEHAPIPLSSRRADVPEPVSAAVHRALSKSPNDRFPSAAAFADALRPFADG